MKLEISEKNLERLDGRSLAALLRAMPEAKTVQMLLPAIVGSARIDSDVIRAAADCLVAGTPPALLEALRDSAEKKNPLAQWLLAEISEQTGDNAGALKLREAVVAAGGFGQLRDAAFALAQTRNRAGDVAGAFDALLSALRAETVVAGEAQAFFQKADRLYARILPKLKTPAASARPLKIAVLGSSTTTFLLPALRMIAVRGGFFPEIYESAYGAFRQEILDTNSGLYAFAPDFVVIATHWRDAHLPAFSENPEKQIAGVVGELKTLWATLQAKIPCTILQHNFDIPHDDPAGYLGTVEPTGRAACLRRLNERLVAEAPRGVVIVDIESLSGELGKSRWAVARHRHMSKQHPAPDCLPALAETYVTLIRAALGMTKKVLVLDLDNTLWRGIIGEDGLAGIRVGAPSPEGEAHAALQCYALELKERGILLAVCSKNNDADARQPFEKHDGMVLKLEDFVAFSANWEDKPTNLRRMAKALNLGLDSFVFLDDNPVERAAMRRELPEVAVPEINAGEPDAYIEILRRGRWFESLALSGEDRARHASYKANAAREELQTAAGNVEDFLKQLSMKATRGAFNAEVLDRVAQLIGKTNQFNLTTRRHSLEQVRQISENPNAWTQWFRLEDKFGDNGLIGLMIALPAADAPATWEIDTFLMSCRVIGRKMEDYMFATLADEARRRGIKKIIGRYLPTSKNGMVAGLYGKLGFEPEPAGQSEKFIFDLAGKNFVFPDYFQTVALS